jgi:hypothetical protein
MPGCYEMTWAKDDRGIFAYGPEVRPGQPHVIWLAIGTPRDPSVGPGCWLARSAPASLLGRGRSSGPVDRC